jgi:ribosomal protein S18 acetylase RimI-like enzyme
MAQTRADLGVHLTTLRPSDEAAVRKWLVDHLRVHNRAWVAAHGLGWTPAETELQMLVSDLVEQHWSSVQRASRRDDQFVAVTRLDDRLLGLVWAGRHNHAYLHVPVGVLNWVYVAPWARQHGVGTVLIEAAKEWMRARELKSVEVSVLAENEPARRLYARAGLAVADVRMMGPLGGS